MSTLSISLVAVAVVALATAVAWVLRDYRAWRDLGPGGLPPNAIGWVKTTAMRLQKGDPLDTRRYEARIDDPRDSAFLTKLPQRLGSRPRIAPHPVPHRQLDQFVGEEMKQKIAKLFDEVTSLHSDTLEYKLSYLEKRHQAIFLRDPAQGHADAANSHGEVAHIHPSDSSMHMIFSSGDAKTVILGGWGERHPLAGNPLRGTDLVLPDTYLLIYPSRNDLELGVVAQLLDAAVNHMKQNSPASARS
jgi:hypothetical protein